MREYSIMGLPFKEYPLKEASEYYRSLMRSPGMHLTSFISYNEILEIVDSKIYQKWFGAFEYIISPDMYSDKESVDDVKASDFLDNLLRELMASKAGIYLLCDTKAHLDSLKQVLDRYSTIAENTFNIVGEDLYDEVNKEAIFNRINVECPVMIISTMTFDMQGHVMMEGRKLLSASVWLGLIPSVVENIKKGRHIWDISFKTKFEFRWRLERYHREHKNQLVKVNEKRKKS